MLATKHGNNFSPKEAIQVNFLEQIIALILENMSTFQSRMNKFDQQRGYYFVKMNRLILLVRMPDGLSIWHLYDARICLLKLSSRLGRFDACLMMGKLVSRCSSKIKAFATFYQFILSFRFLSIYYVTVVIPEIFPELGLDLRA